MKYSMVLMCYNNCSKCGLCVEECKKLHKFDDIAGIKILISNPYNIPVLTDLCDFCGFEYRCQNICPNNVIEFGTPETLKEKALNKKTALFTLNK